MTFIYSFLQKRKMHESQHGVVMVVLAYALSVLLLVLGSDVFYNIKSTAAGTNVETEEETQETTFQDFNGLQAVEALNETETASTDSDHLNEVQASEAAVNTCRLPQSAMNDQSKTTMLEQMNAYVQQAEPVIEQETEQVVELEADQIAETIDQSDTSEQTSVAAEEDEDSIESFSVEVASFDTIVTITAEEIKMLERIVEAEAEGEDMVGKILIANVVLNRIAADEFPDSVEEVIFQNDDGDYQFSPVESGRYWSVDISEDTEAAVKRALDGEDHSEGALYFVAKKRTSSSSARWFDSNLTWLFKHGGHEFYK